MAENPRTRWRAGYVAAYASLALLYVAIRLRLLAVPLERDEGVFGVIGQAILRGELPYRDVFEHKPPGVFYVYALALLAVPPTATGVHAFLAVWNLATTACVGALAAALASPAAAPWAILVFVVASAAPSVQGFSATSEMLLLLPLTASVLAAVAAADGRGTTRALLAGASGALAAATFWMKQPALLGAAAGPLVLAVRGRRARDLAAWAAGAVVVTLAVTVPFAVAGVSSEFWYWVFTHSWLYGQLPVAHWPARLAAALRYVGGDLGVALALAIAGGVVGVRRGRPGAGLALAFLALSAASALHSTFFYTHYFALVAPATAVAAAFGIVALADAVGRTARVPLGVATIIALVAPPVALRPWYWIRPDPRTVITRALGAQGFEAAPLVARYLRERTAPDERVFVWGSEPEIAFAAERRDVNPFGMVYPLTWTWPRHREFQERVWAAIERGRPAYIVVARSPMSFVRAPDIDTFFEERLADLGRRVYRLDALVVEDPDGGPRIVSDPPGDGATRVVFELWRRAP
jgi:hypothetical protein